MHVTSELVCPIALAERFVNRTLAELHLGSAWTFSLFDAGLQERNQGFALGRCESNNITHKLHLYVEKHFGDRLS